MNLLVQQKASSTLMMPRRSHGYVFLNTLKFKLASWWVPLFPCTAAIRAEISCQDQNCFFVNGCKNINLIQFNMICFVTIVFKAFEAAISYSATFLSKTV